MSEGTKLIVFLVVIAGVVVTYISPLNECFPGLFPGELEKKEQQLVGSVAGVNPRVKEIQQMLVALKIYAGAVDGKLGPQTRKALQAFQEESGITVTGKIDPRTLIMLKKRTVARIKDDKGYGGKQELPLREFFYDAKMMQTFLKGAGFYGGEIDGKVGPLTVKAIKQFQKKKNLKESGIMDEKTWEELKKEGGGRGGN